MGGAARSFMRVMTLHEIRTAIEQASERRGELWARLSRGHDAEVAAELKRLDDELDHLYDEQRHIRATLRFGPREHIVARARVEERLERAA
jgi:DNA-binding transcriptional MerR regulator